MIRRLTILLFVTIFFVTISFFWAEKFDFSKPINHEKVGSFFTSIGALVTAYSLYLLYRQTVLTQQSQNVAIAPDLHMQDFFFPLHKAEPETNAFRRMFLFAISNPSHVNDSKPEFTLLNRGDGSAKNVQVFWTYSSDRMEKFTEDENSDSYSLAKYLTGNEFAQIKTGEVIKINASFIPNFLDEYLSSWVNTEEKSFSLPLVYLHINYIDSLNQRFNKLYAASVNIEQVSIIYAMRIAFKEI